jgi:hypothetical protein
MTLTKVRVRAQAFGGKIIGENVEQAPQLAILIDGHVVQDSLTIKNQASGTVLPAQQPGLTSPYPILVQAPAVPNFEPPDTYWLEPPAAGDSDCVVTIDVASPTEVEFRVTAFAPAPTVGSVKRIIVPGDPSNTSQLGVVVPVQGLYVPAFSVTRIASSDFVQIAATVAMLCGCPIGSPDGTLPPEKYWPATEFEVIASFLAEGAASLPPVSVKLSCGDPNAFGGSVELPRGAGWRAMLEALQPATLNTGSASTIVPAG